MLLTISMMSRRAPERAQINVSNALTGTQTISSPKWNYNMFRKWMQTAAVGEKKQELWSSWSVFLELSLLTFYISPVVLMAMEWSI